MPKGFLRLHSSGPAPVAHKPNRPNLIGQIPAGVNQAIGNLFDRIQQLEVSHAHLAANALTKVQAEAKYSPAVIREALQATGSHPMKAYSLLGVPFHGFVKRLTATADPQVFLLPSIPSPPEHLILVVGGAIMTQGVGADYTVSGPKVMLSFVPTSTPGPAWWLIS
jgi:hypothetical protein